MATPHSDAMNIEIILIKKVGSMLLDHSFSAQLQITDDDSDWEKDPAVQAILQQSAGGGEYQCSKYVNHFPLLTSQFLIVIG